MKFNLKYKDIATFAIAESGDYRGSKIVTEQHDVKCIFIQSINFQSSGFQEVRDADAIIFPNPKDAFILDNYYRLEGMYVVMPLFDSSDGVSWYRITSVTVNRDHLLSNKTDNIECLLKKVDAIATVS